MDEPLALDRSLIRVSGPDARPFLDNLLTQNIASDARVLYAGLLSPQGKVVCDMLVWNGGDGADGGIILETAPHFGTALLRRLTLYKLRANVAIEDMTGAFHVLYAPEFFRGGAPDPRFPNGALGWREISPPPPEQYAFADGTDAYAARRIALGVPELAADAGAEEVFALEALFEELNGVDFHKGCFVGQENVSRMKRRATTRKKFCPIAFEGDPPAFGAPILAGAAEVGGVRSGVPGRAIALLRLDRVGEAPLSCEGRPVRLDPPPWLILPGAEAP